MERTFGGLHEDDIPALMDEGREQGYEVESRLSADDYHYEVIWRK